MVVDLGVASGLHLAVLDFSDSPALGIRKRDPGFGVKGGGCGSLDSGFMVSDVASESRWGNRAIRAGSILYAPIEDPPPLNPKPPKNPGSPNASDC